jgi:hypothetical protein
MTEHRNEHGVFEGIVTTTWLNDGRTMQLEKPVSFTDAAGTPWPVPAPWTIDGASIPRVFWTVIGGPFEGNYRNASVVHDYYCDTRSRSWKATHRMFYDAMLCTGVSASRARVMYYAVLVGGPRWSEAAGPARESGGAPSATRVALSPVDEQALANDLAFVESHPLSLEQIEELAEFRVDTHGAGAAGAARESAGAAGLAWAVTIGGSGTREDAEAVSREVAHIPAYVVEWLVRHEARIVACRDDVTDFATHLRDERPRGWGDGENDPTWVGVPGVYLPGEKCVVIATRDEGGTRAVPLTGQGHGSSNLVVHETLHAYDYMREHDVLGDPRFVSARDSDLAAGEADDPHLTYYRQPGQAGLEETFAESGARFCSGAGEWPALTEHWASEAPASPQQARREAAAVEGSSHIGTAKLLADGAIEVNLRASDDSGAIGHFLWTVNKDHPRYATLAAQFDRGPGRESGRRGPILVNPFD